MKREISAEQRLSFTKVLLTLIVLGLTCGSAFAQRGQGVSSPLDGVSSIPEGMLDQTWSVWHATGDADPRVLNAPYLPAIQYRWRRLTNPYRCELEFRNPGTLARDFKYTVQYDTGITYQPRKSFDGSRLGVLGASSDHVFLSDCYSVFVGAGGVTITSNGSSLVDSLAGVWTGYFFDHDGAELVLRRTGDRLAGTVTYLSGDTVYEETFAGQVNGDGSLLLRGTSWRAVAGDASGGFNLDTVTVRLDGDGSLVGTVADIRTSGRIRLVRMLR